MVIMDTTTAFHRSVPEITQSILQQPDQVQHAITFFFKTREYRKLHEIVKALLKAGFVIDDTCLRLYGASVCDLTIGSACEIWAWFLSFKLTPALIHLFRVFMQHISISADSLVPVIQADFTDHLKQTEDMIETHLQKGSDLIDWLNLCHVLGHEKLLFMIHRPETISPLTKKVKWYDMSLVFGIAFDWKSFFTESLKSDGPEKEIAFRLLMLKLKFCDAMCTFTESKRLLKSSQQLVHQILIQPDIGNCLLLQDSAIDCILQSVSDSEQDVILVAQALVKQMLTKKDNNQAKVKETTILSCAAFQTAVIGSLIAELLQVTSKESDLHPILTLMSESSDSEWIQFQYSVPSENNKCWHSIREASQMMMKSRESSASSDKLFTISSAGIGRILISMSHLVFLPALLPLNQSRCIILYHMLIMHWNTKDKMRNSLIDALIQMLSSTRSIWLFDFVPPSFLLLNIPSKREAPQVAALINAILCRVLKHENLLTDVKEKIVQEKDLGEKEHLHCDLLQAYAESKANSHVCRSDIVSQVVEAAINKVLKGLRKSESADSERFVKSAEHLHSLSLLLQVDPENGNRKIVALVKKVLRNIFSNGQILNNDDHEAKFLQVVCERRQSLDAILSEEFVSELCNKVFGPRQNQDAFYSKSSSSCSDTDVRETIHRPVKRFRSDKAVHSVFHANLIQSLLESCNETECTSLCREWRSRFTESADNSVVLIQCLQLWADHCTPAASEAELRRDAEAAGELVFDLTNRLRNRVGEGVDVHLMMSSLKLTHSLMRAPFGKFLPLNPVLNVTAFVVHEIRKLLSPAADRVTDFAGIILAAQAVLFQAIVCQKIAVITVMPYFNILTSRLFRMCLSLCDEQLLNTCSSQAAGVTEQAERCAQSVSSLISALCNISDFHPFAAELLVTYVHYVQSHIIHHRINPILLSAVYSLLRVIGNKHSHTLERQHVRLNQAAKDLLKQFTANYEQFYRYRGYV
jgi:hypothetical protein